MANSESLEYLNQARYFAGVEKYADALEYINSDFKTEIENHSPIHVIVENS